MCPFHLLLCIIIIVKAPGIYVTHERDVGKIGANLITPNDDVKVSKKRWSIPARSVDWQISSINRWWLALVPVRLPLKLAAICALDGVGDDDDDGQTHLNHLSLIHISWGTSCCRSNHSGPTNHDGIVAPMLDSRSIDAAHDRRPHREPHRWPYDLLHTFRQ